MKHIVTRKCVYCREIKPLRELIRVAKNGEDVKLDPTGKMQGRGAYICRNEACVQGAYKKRRIDASLKCCVPKEIYTAIGGQINGKG